MCRAFYFSKVISDKTAKLQLCPYHRFSRIVHGLVILALCIPLTVRAIGVSTLVVDLTPIPYQVGFDISSRWYPLDQPNPISAHEALFFVGWDETNGVELWKSDGTTRGTVLVKDIYPGNGDAKPAQFVLTDKTLFFTADDGSSGQELWKTDGTPNGTVQVKDIITGPQGSSPKNLTLVNNILFFSVASENNSDELWKSDGTVTGTVQIKAAFPLLTSGPNLSDFTVANNKLFFTATDGISGRELWTSDGSEAGTTLVTDIEPGTNGSSPSYLTGVSGTVFFVILNDSDDELWKSDGTKSGTVLVQNFGKDFVFNLFAVNETLFFMRRDNNSAVVSLWKSNSTGAGTTLIREFEKGSLDHLTNLNNALLFFFNASSDLTNPKHSLWRSDGTTDGTIMLHEFDHAPAVATTVTSNGVLFFSENANPLNNELWISDGTFSNTRAIFALGEGRVDYLTSVSNTIFFFKFCETTDCGLWRILDTTTVLLKPLVPAQGSSVIKQFVLRSKELFFTRSFINDNKVANKTLWKTDGTTANSKPIKTFSDTSFNNPNPFVLMNQLLFFIADDGSGTKLWRSDGTTEGTTIVKDSRTTALIHMEERLFFVTQPDGNVSLELWKSDGTGAGTLLVKRIDYTELPCYVWLSDMISAQGIVFFSVNIASICTPKSMTYVSEIWKTDGTDLGTARVKRFGEARSTMYGNTTPASLAELTDVNGTLFFAARETGDINVLWRSDGTLEGTIALTLSGSTAHYTPTELTNVDGTLFFRIDDGVHGPELWKSDGTVAGTTLVKDILPGSLGSMPTELTAVKGKLFFSANDGNSGRELWQSDSTTEGTVLVKEILPGPGGAVPQQLTNINNSLVFSASDGQHGVEAWWSNGTAEGTTLIQDIAPGTANANPDQFTFAGHQLFLTANDGLAGQELWSLRSFTEKVEVEGGELRSWLDHTTYQFPRGTFSAPVTVTHTLSEPAQLAPVNLWQPVRTFELRATDRETGASVQPRQPYSLTAQYTEAELGVVNEETVALYYWDGQQWSREANSTVDVTNHLITANPTHIALWAIGGETYPLFLPIAGK